MFLRTEYLKPKKLIGFSNKMNLYNVGPQTQALWKKLMPARNLVQHRVGSFYYSLQDYEFDYSFQTLDPSAFFTKWAAVEVFDFAGNDNFESFKLVKGNYAVFLHKGLPSAYPKTMGFIMGQWLPNSDYVLDNRPHFELITADYKPNDPEAEEEIWIPIKSS